MPELICEYKIGSQARIVVGDDVEGIITSVCFYTETYCKYELTWVHDGDVKSGWFMPVELKLSEKGKSAGGPALAPRPEGTGDETEPATPIFVAGDRVRIRKSGSVLRGRIGIVKDMYGEPKRGWWCDIQLDAPDPVLSQGWEESALEAVEGDEIEAPKAKFKKGDRVRMAGSVMSLFEGKIGIVECAGRDPAGKLTYRINFTGEGDPHLVPQFFETSNESQLEAIENEGPRFKTGERVESRLSGRTGIVGAIYGETARVPRYRVVDDGDHSVSKIYSEDELEAVEEGAKDE